MPDRDRPRLCRVAGREAWHVYHRRRRVSTGSALRASAEIFLASYIAEQARPTADESLSISAILTRYLADRQDAGIPGAARLGWAHQPLKRFWGERPPEAITDAECRAYVRRRATERSGPHDKPAGAGTARTELQALRAALNWATAKHLIERAPKVLMPSRPPPRQRWLTRDEAQALEAACHGVHVRLFVVLALHTAGRAGALLALTWDRVDLERRLVDLRDPDRAATRKGRAMVPINDTLLPVLTQAHALRTSDWVIEYGGGQVGSVKHGFRDAVTRAGLKAVTPHTLRHTAATWMVQKGVPLWEVAGYLGHSSPAMISDTYAHHSPDFLQNAARALG